MSAWSLGPRCLDPSAPRKRTDGHASCIPALAVAAPPLLRDRGGAGAHRAGLFRVVRGELRRLARRPRHAFAGRESGCGERSRCGESRRGDANRGPPASPLQRPLLWPLTRSSAGPERCPDSAHRARSGGPPFQPSPGRCLDRGRLARHRRVPLDSGHLRPSRAPAEGCLTTAQGAALPLPTKPGWLL